MGKNIRKEEIDTKSKYIIVMCKICHGQGVIDVGFNDYKECPAKCSNGFVSVKNVNYTEIHNKKLSN